MDITCNNQEKILLYISYALKRNSSWSVFLIRKSFAD
jgi:hypothetical protein